MMTEDKKLLLANEWQKAREASDAAFRTNDGAASTGQAAYAHRVALTYAKEAGIVVQMQQWPKFADCCAGKWSSPQIPPRSVTPKMKPTEMWLRERYLEARIIYVDEVDKKAVDTFYKALSPSEGAWFRVLRDSRLSLDFIELEAKS